MTRNDLDWARPNGEGRRVSTFDAQNRMTACTYTGRDENGTLTTWQSAFTYGADGLRRHARVVNHTAQTLTTTSSMLDGFSVVREVIDRPGTENDETVTYLTGASGPTYRRSGTGRKTWYAYDGRLESRLLSH